MGTLPAAKILFLGNSITLHGPKPDIGWMRSKGGSPFGEVVVEVVGGGDVVVVLASDGSAAPCSRRVGEQAVTKPAARRPSMCRRESGAGAMNHRTGARIGRGPGNRASL